MFDTYFELEAKMGDGVDYKNTGGDDRLFSTCKCKGRVPAGEPQCTRNPKNELSSKGAGLCLWFLSNGNTASNGSNHCGHRFTHKKEET